MAHGQDDRTPAADETHVSPDGALTLLIFYGDDPMVAFAGQAWHAHGETFPELGSPREAVAQIAADILGDRRPIIECWEGDQRVDVWAPEDNDFDFGAFIAADQSYREHGEDWRVRYWSGDRSGA